MKTPILFLLTLLCAATITGLVALPDPGAQFPERPMTLDQPEVDCNFPIAVDRLDALPATRTPGDLYPDCSFVPGDPNVIHSALDCTLAPPGFCQLGRSEE